VEDWEEPISSRMADKMLRPSPPVIGGSFEEIREWSGMHLDHLMLWKLELDATESVIWDKSEGVLFHN
jgi:hypothetical protein